MRVTAVAWVGYKARLYLKKKNQYKQTTTTKTLLARYPAFLATALRKKHRFSSDDNFGDNCSPERIIKKRTRIPLPGTRY